MAALAHGSILLNLFVPGLGIVAAFAVWLTQRGRSVYAEKQALQAGIYQLVWTMVPIGLIILGVIMVITGAIASALANATIGLAVLVPLAIMGALALVALVVFGLIYALLGAYEAYQGRDFHYWLIGRLAQ